MTAVPRRIRLVWFAHQAKIEKGFWRNCHLERVVFGGPDDVETALVGHLDHFQRMTSNFLHVQAVVNPLKVYSKLEFHG